MNVYEHRWLKYSVLRNVVVGPLYHNEVEMTIYNMVDEKGKWRMELFSFPLIDEVVDEIKSKLVHKNCRMDDWVKWLHGKDGKFDLNECYRVTN